MYYFIMFLLPMLSACSSGFQEEVIKKPGNITYSCEGGKIQCISEKDRSGQVFVKLSCLDPYTSIKFENATQEQGRNYISLLMMIDKQDTGCARWRHHQQLLIELNPVLVESSNLNGDLIFQGPSFQVFM